MNLVEQLKNDRMAFFKEGDKRSYMFLSTLVGDLESDQKRGIDINDGYVVKMIKKSVENAQTNFDLTGKDLFQDEINFWQQYLPKQLSEDDLRNEIASIIANLDESNRNIGSVMSALKGSFDGQYDGKIASTLVRQALSN